MTYSNHFINAAKTVKIYVMNDEVGTCLAKQFLEYYAIQAGLKGWYFLDQQFGRRCGDHAIYYRCMFPIGTGLECCGDG